MVQFKRRNYFINKDFQGKYIFNYFLLVLIGSVLFMAVFSFFSSNTLSISYDNYQLQLGLTPGILFKKILSTQWIFIVIGGTVVVFMTIFLTHRVAGPFFRFERALNEMISGNISNRIVLRDKDEGKDLAKKINAFNAVLSDKFTIIEEMNEKIALASQGLKKALADPKADRNKAIALADEILACHKEIRAILDGYEFSREG